MAEAPVYNPMQLQLQRQLEQAQALQKRPRQQFSDPWATAISGLGEVLGSGVGAWQQRRLGDELQQSLAQSAAEDAALDDPMSEASKKAQEAIRTGVWGAHATPDMLGRVTARGAKDFEQQLSELARLKQSREESESRNQLALTLQGGANAAAALRQERELGYKQAKDEAEAARRAEEAQKEAEAKAAKEAEEARKKAEGRPLSADDALSVEGAASAMEALEVIGKKFDELGVSGLGGAAGALVGKTGLSTDAAKYNDARNVAARAIGSQLQPTQLTDADERSYAAMLPEPGDSAARKAEKMENVRRLIQSARESRLRALNAAGFNTSRLVQTPAGQREAPGSFSLSTPATGGGGQPAPAAPFPGAIRIRDRASKRMGWWNPAEGKVPAEYEVVSNG